VTTTTDTVTAPEAGTLPERRAGGAGTRTALGVELRKLAAQRRSRLTLLGVLVAPILVTLVLKGQQRPPKDTLFGRHVHDSGFGMALFTLSFVTQWVLPFLTAIVAGDIFAGEDHLGTWKTVLTRSVSRTQVFVAKCLTAGLFATAVLVVLAASTIASGVVLVGHQPLTGLTGQLIPASTAFWSVSAAWATVLLPLLAFTAIAILLSVVSRNPAVAIVGAIFLGLGSQLVSWLGGMDPVRRLLPTTPFEAWHGLFTRPRFSGLLTQGAWVSAAWIAVCLGVAAVSFRRRDVTGG
jgi:ABC-2 type transport system permease protein